MSWDVQRGSGSCSQEFDDVRDDGMNKIYLKKTLVWISGSN